MAGKLTSFRERRLTAVAEMMVLNFSANQIMDGLQRRGIPCPAKGSIYQDMQIIGAEMRQRRQMALDARITLELTVLETIRQKSLQAYENSTRGTITRETTSESEAVPVAGIPQDNGDGESPMTLALREMLHGGGMRQAKIVEKTKEVTSSGDPRFLDTALGASREIRTLLGVDPVTVKQIELVTRDSGAISIDKVREMDPSAIARLIADEIASAAGA